MIVKQAEKKKMHVWNVSNGLIAQSERVYQYPTPFLAPSLCRFMVEAQCAGMAEKKLFRVQRGRGGGGGVVLGDGCTYGALLRFTSSNGIPCWRDLGVRFHMILVVLVVIGERGEKE